MDDDKKAVKPSISLPPEVLQSLAEASEKTGISVSQLVRACVIQKLAAIVSSMTGGEEPSSSTKNKPRS